MIQCYVTKQLNSYLDRIDQEESRQSALDELIEETAQNLMNDVPVTVGRTTWNFDDVLTNVLENEKFLAVCKALALAGSDPTKLATSIAKYQKLLNEAATRIASDLAEQILLEKQNY